MQKAKDERGRRARVVTRTEPAQRGRPRNREIDAIVLETTRQLLGEAGFAATTVQEISRRSGVHPPAIYRRWPSRLALIEDAAFSGLTEIAMELFPSLEGPGWWSAGLASAR